MVKSREELESLKCVPCRGGIPPLAVNRIEELAKLVPGWKYKKNGIDKIKKRFKFKDFSEAMWFVNKVADLAEQEDHHPDIHISWNRVTFILWTHVIKGLHENDFILAAKIDRLLEEKKR